MRFDRTDALCLILCSGSLLMMGVEHARGAVDCDSYPCRMHDVHKLTTPLGTECYEWFEKDCRFCVGPYYRCKVFSSVTPFCVWDYDLDQWLKLPTYCRSVCPPQTDVTVEAEEPTGGTFTSVGYAKICR